MASGDRRLGDVRVRLWLRLVLGLGKFRVSSIKFRVNGLLPACPNGLSSNDRKNFNEDRSMQITYTEQLLTLNDSGLH